MAKLAVCPAFLKEEGAQPVRGVMNCVFTSNLADYAVPPDCFLLSRDESERFHGTLSYHPPCSPIVPINSAPKTALRTLFKGPEKDVNRVIEAILKKRAGLSWGFNNVDDLRAVILAKQLEAEIHEQYSE